MSKNIFKKIEKLNISHEQNDYMPIIFNLKKESDIKLVNRLIKEKKIIAVIDEFCEQKNEFRIVKNPRRLFLHPSTKKYHNKTDAENGKWIYFPWRFSLVHILDFNDFVKLRSSRNKDLIREVEQKKYAAAKIGIAGLNVGNPAALCMALEGGGRVMKFADNDVLSLSNLNRFRASLIDLGLNKAILSARQVYEVDPYYQIKVFPRGIISGKTREFLMKPRIDVLVEEMDNLPLKIEMREEARKNRIPVVMVTGNGENVIIDIERFDQNSQLPFLNGHLKPSIIKAIKKGSLDTIPMKQRVLMARDFMGVKFLTKRLNDSFQLVGTNLAGIPQIAESSFLRGAAVAYCVRQIVTGKKLLSGRYFLNLSDITIKR